MKSGITPFYNIDLRGAENPNEYVELVKIFLRPSEFHVLADGGAGKDDGGAAGMEEAHGAPSIRLPRPLADGR